MMGVFSRMGVRLRRLGAASVTGLMMSAALVVVADAAAGDKRVALVIGNGAYQSVPALENPLTDSKAVAAALKRIGFDVVEGYDLRLDAMRAAVGEYAVKLDGAKVAFVYYAGHGVAVAGENYLLPTDTVLKSEADLDFRTMNINLVMRQMQREDRVNVVVLDACRDNPFAKELARSLKTRSTSVAAGLSEIAVGSAAGTMIAFATDPGKTAMDGISGGNSPFTTALLKHMETPNVSISTVMDRVREDVWRSTGEKQRPWVNTSIIGEFYLNPSAKPVTQVAAADATTLVPAPLPATAPTPQSLEIRLWESAERSGSPEDYKSYLEAHPNGYFAQIARNRIARSVSPAAGSTPAAAIPVTDSAALKSETGSTASETVLNLSAKDRSEAQARLKALGYDPGGATGKFGPGTRRALTNWQKTHDIPASGFLTKAQKDALWAESEPEYARLAAAPAAAIGAAPVVARTVRPAAVPRPQAPRVVAVPAVRRPVAAQPAPAQRGPSLGEVGNFLGGVGSLVNSVRR